METDDFLSVQLLAPGLTMLPKQAQLEAIRKVPATSRLTLQRELSNVRIRTYGPTALLTAVATFRGKDSKGAPVASQAFVTELWVNEGGKWRISHFHPVAIPPKAPAAAPAPVK
jgi:ketosteroid isomerase-like protein